MSTFGRTTEADGFAQAIASLPKRLRDLFDGIDRIAVASEVSGIELGSLPKTKSSRLTAIEKKLLFFGSRNIGGEDPMQICSPIIDDIARNFENACCSDLGSVQSKISESFRAALCRDVSDLTAQCATFETRSRALGLRHDDRLGFFSCYPVVARILAARLAGREHSAKLLAKRLASDSHRLQSKWGCPIATLEAIDWNFSDPHWGGASVARLSFSGGLQLYYKPRSFAANSFLLGLAEAIGLDLPELVPEHLDCGGHGYALSVPSKPAEDESSVRKYYRRCGQLAVLAQIAGLTDVHSENLVAKSDRPVVIDSETIGDPSPLDAAYAASRQGVDFLIVRQTPLRSSLFPMPMLAGDRISDLSAFGGVGEQASPVETRSLRGDRPAKTERRTLAARANTLLFNGEVQHPSDHFEQVLQGMQEASQLIDERQAAIAAYVNAYSDASLDARWVARPTAFYEKLIENLTHPSLAADLLAADAFLVSRLATHSTWSKSSLLSSERRQIWEGDIPAFRLQGTDLWAHDDRRVACVEFSNTLLREVTHRLSDNNNQVTLRQQIASLSLAADLSCKTRTNSGPFVGPENAGLPLDLDDIINLLNATAIETEANIGWLALRSLLIDRYSPATTDLSLYDGAAGILVFTSACTALLGNPVAERLSSKLLEMIFHNSEDLVQYGVGGYDGISGICYGVEQAGRFLGRDTRAFRSVCLAALREKLRSAGEYEPMDLVCGWAGCLLVTARLLDLNSLADIERAEWRCFGDDVAVLIGSRAQFDERRSTARWTPIRALSQLPHGLAHGAGGIALALAEWARISCDEDALRLACLAGRHEMAAFNSQSNGWIDYRTGRISNFWCYGAAGLVYAFEGLARHNAEDWGDVLDQSKLAATLFNKEQCGSLCHGAIGNMRSLEESRHELPWNEVDLSLPGGSTIPGLMTGISGVGISLLERHVGRKLLPNVLTLSFREEDTR